MDLREKIATAIWKKADEHYLETEDLDHCGLMADAVLAIPEIAEALGLCPDTLTGCADDQAFADVSVEAMRRSVKNLGHSIRVRDPG